MGVVTTVKGEGTCDRIELERPEITIRINFLTINLGKRDVVVGIPWLCSTGWIRVHESPKSHAIKKKHQLIVLRGIDLNYG